MELEHLNSLKPQFAEFKKYITLSSVGLRLLYWYPLIVRFFLSFSFEESLIFTATFGTLWYLSALIIYGYAEINIDKRAKRLNPILRENSLPFLLTANNNYVVVLYGALFLIITSFSDDSPNWVNLGIGLGIGIYSEWTLRRQNQVLKTIDDALSGNG